MIRVGKFCRGCGGNLLPVLSLGKIVPSTFLKPEDPDPAPQPLELTTCSICNLVQLQHTVDADSLYRQYWYVSGINEIMRRELADVVGEGLSLLGRLPKRVVDIGANDGTLLSFYPSGVKRIAYEPALNLQARLAPHAEIVVPDFFPAPLPGLHSRIGRQKKDPTGHWREKIDPEPLGADLITSIAMFYDLDDPKAFIKAIDLALSPDGIWILQFQDLAQMIATNAFDNIGHEHLCYYSLRSFGQMLDDEVDLKVVKVERREINGGSLRIYVRRRDQAADEEGIQAQLDSEAKWTSGVALEQFAWRMGEIRSQLQAIVRSCLAQHGTVDLYAASTKSSTLLQYCGLDHTVIRQAVERTPEKVGLVTSGTRIPIVNEHTWRMDPAPVTIQGAYQFAEAFIAREPEYLSQGGQWLIPLPHARLMSAQALEVVR